MASTEEKSTNGKPKAKAKSDKKPKCGIVMPISDMDGYPSGHWNDVLTILETVVKEADFEVDLVSNADEVTVIHQTIVQNLYENDIVICDVSGKNANVMFELGMRLAFDKPTIIIIDDRTEFSFDTGVISHVLYPSDLRFPKMVEFQKNLKSRILGTHKKAGEDANYSPFLKHFGRYKIAGLETQELSADKYIVEKLSALMTEVRSLKNDRHTYTPSIRTKSDRVKREHDFVVFDVRGDREELSSFALSLLHTPLGIIHVEISTHDEEGRFRFYVYFIDTPTKKIIDEISARIIGNGFRIMGRPDHLI